MSTGAFSGKNGNLKNGATVIEFKSWQIKVTEKTGAYVSNQTAGWEDQVDGPSNWGGTLEIYDLAAAWPATVGSVWTLAGYRTGSETTPAGGSAKIVDVEEMVDVESEKPLMLKVTFRGKGAFTQPAA